MQFGYTILYVHARDQRLSHRDLFADGDLASEQQVLEQPCRRCFRWMKAAGVRVTD